MINMPKQEERTFDREKADMVNSLFDAVSHETGKRELGILQAIYGNTQETTDMLWHLLRNISECPNEVVVYCQNLLNKQT